VKVEGEAKVEGVAKDVVEEMIGVGIAAIE
jgi:hypothetical protein